MKKFYFKCLTAIALGMSVFSIAQIAFPACPKDMYLTQYPSGGGTSLYTLDNATNPLTITKIGATTATTIKLNGMGFNPIDNFIYALNIGDNHLYKVDVNFAIYDLGTVTGLPAGDYISGDIDFNGNYYVKANTSAGGQDLYKINITTKTATLIHLSHQIKTADFAYSKDQFLYGVDEITNKLYKIDLRAVTLGNVTIIGDTNHGGDYGAMYADGITGAVYGNRNSDDDFYSFNKTTGAATVVSKSIATIGNDGAHCSTAPILFGVDLAITKTDGKTEYVPNTTNTYTVTVSNAGPFTAINAVVTDLVPTGIPAANVSYTAVASSGSDTSVVGTKTGAINDVVNVQKDGTITYTITMLVPVDFTGNLVNTASVKASVDNVETNMSNNLATDTDCTSVCYELPNTAPGIDSNHGVTLLQRAGADNGNWPMIRKSAYTVLESDTKGFVITRMTTTQINAIVLPQEGMMVFDTDSKCLKLFADGVWSCFNTATCK
ncbi:DUF11 domain-containing protein [Kaistella flava (ex Peng et al. 2021)]|uniref:DUF11 domain-containing protein n=1 Tax=Kaistella flava (ex Peng et al. 2021) TaxID=2038776 RepID=A0A7M2Y8W8_9FLAO|nr:DUF11 domain-containing protein [Kaistella flava (ex Peng et al. 2021)]QOW10698.1 DUF11 domain-containing protein [Kaistella flava (ex Peng et al. 2021)]